MIYRLYSAQDFDALYAIEELCFQPPHRFARSYMRQLVDSRDAATWIAELQGCIAGFAIVEWARQANQIVSYLETIEVDPQQRGRGVAGDLLRRAEGSARTAGARVIWLHVDAENHAAIRLYISSGYLLKGREEGYYGRGRTALIYVKPLDAC